MLEWERIFGLLFSGFMVKLYALAMGVTLACYTGSFLLDTFGKIAAVWP